MRLPLPLLFILSVNSNSRFTLVSSSSLGVYVGLSVAVNIKVKEHLRFRRLRMNRQPNVQVIRGSIPQLINHFQFTIKNGKPEPIPINNITIPTTSNSTNPKDDSSPLSKRTLNLPNKIESDSVSILPLSGLLIMLILFICYLLPYVSFRNRGSCCGRCWLVKRFL